MISVKGLSEAIGRTVKKDNLKFAFNNKNNLGTLVFSNMKQKINPLEKKNIVYKIPCDECNSVYIGQISQKL